MKYWQAINLALTEELERDQRVIVLGEDVAVPGGTFGATRGLLDRFGPARVRDTPISENGMMGVAVGAAMAGLRPLVEIQFMDFLPLTSDQLVNQAAKMRYMSNGTYSVPLVVRSICGSHRGSGPQHSQHFEAMLAGVPGLKLVWPSSPAEARALYAAAIRDDDPVIVVDDLSLWGTRGEVPSELEPVPLGRARIARSGRDVTVVSWGGVVRRVEAVAARAAESGIEVEAVDLRCLAPLDIATVLGSVARTGRLLVVEDASGICSVGSQVVSSVATQGFGRLQAPPVHLHAPFAPVPFPPAMEEAYYPDEASIQDAVECLVGRPVGAPASVATAALGTA